MVSVHYREEMMGKYQLVSALKGHLQHGAAADEVYVLLRNRHCFNRWRKAEAVGLLRRPIHFRSGQKSSFFWTLHIVGAILMPGE